VGAFATLRGGSVSRELQSEHSQANLVLWIRSWELLNGLNEFNLLSLRGDSYSSLEMVKITISYQ